MRGVLRTIYALGIVGIVTPVACAGLALATLIFLPLPATLPEASPTLDSRTTVMLDADGNVIATFKEFETAIPVAPSDIPQVLKDAVVAQEDRGFYNHGGVDVRGTLRALWRDIRHRGEKAEGGSTITQQYVRLAFEEVGTERTIARKIREAILASQLDRQVDKETILFGYLSNVYFGEGAYGAGAAARTYFRKNPRDLTLSEAALIVSAIPAPSAYSPRDHPDVAELRRVGVLDQMLGEGYITQEEHDAAAAQTVALTFATDPPPDCTIHTCVYPPEVEESSRPWFTDYVQRWMVGKVDGCTSLDDCPILRRGGLTIETTLDPRMQDAADARVAEVLEGTDPTLEMALVAVEPPTGFVRAMVGGHDFAFNQVNTALGAEGGGTDRSPGSAFKPFVLAEAFEQGIQPEDVFSGQPHDVTDECGPDPETGGPEVLNNYGNARYGNMTLRQGTWKSVNTVFTRLILDVGVDNAIDMARRLGVALTSLPPSYCASIALGGGSDVSPLQMASAYGVFANHGRRLPPTPVLRIVDGDGKVILDNTTDDDREGTQVISAEVADNVTDVLRGVLTSGTASGRGIGRPAAGKTGTAQDNKNAWFVGYTPTLSTSVWLGYLQPQPLTGIAGTNEVTGGSVPARTWQRFMTDALRDVPITEFAEPAPIPDVRDQALRERRGGFDPGARRAPGRPLPAGGFVPGEGIPVVDAPPMTAPSTSSTTSTTTRFPTVPTSTTSLLRP